MKPGQNLYSDNICRICLLYAKHHVSSGHIVELSETRVSDTFMVMISGEHQKPVQKIARWPCGVCGRGVVSNSIQCTSCHKWVHKKCSGK